MIGFEALNGQALIFEIFKIKFFYVYENECFIWEQEGASLLTNLNILNALALDFVEPFKTPSPLIEHF